MRSNCVSGQKGLDESHYLLDGVRRDRKIKPVLEHCICNGCGKSPESWALHKLHPSLCRPRGFPDDPQHERIGDGLRGLFVDR